MDRPIHILHIALKGERCWQFVKYVTWGNCVDCCYLTQSNQPDRKLDTSAKKKVSFCYSMLLSGTRTDWCWQCEGLSCINSVLPVDSDHAKCLLTNSTGIHCLNKESNEVDVCFTVTTSRVRNRQRLRLTLSLLRDSKANVYQKLITDDWCFTVMLSFTD